MTTTPSGSTNATSEVAVPIYRFALLDPRPIPVANETNEKIFASGQVMGIEVTNPKLATMCQLGNIDPQHGPSGDPRFSAIEAAMILPVLPKDGTVLATIRPDSDSVGAMAVLNLRLQGKGGNIDSRLVAALGRMDGLGPQARDLPIVHENADRVSAANFVCLGRNFTLDQKVEWMKNLLTNEIADGVIVGFADELRTELEKAKQSLTVSVFPGNRVALVQGNSPRGFEVGYATGCPIVIAFAPSFLRPGAAEGEKPCEKWTIARYSSAAPIDMSALKARLSELEAGWGGPADLVASPQGLTSTIPPEKIIAAVLAAVITS